MTTYNINQTLFKQCTDVSMNYGVMFVPCPKMKALEHYLVINLESGEKLCQCDTHEKACLVLSGMAWVEANKIVE